MPELLERHELLFLFAGILVLGMAALLPALHLVATGALDPVAVLGAAAAAIWVSDTAWYAAGRALAGAGTPRLPRVVAALERADELLERVGSGPLRLLFLSRFLYGSRIAVSLWCGARRERYASVAATNAASAILWLGVLFAVARVVGSTVERTFDGVRGTELALAALVLTALGLRLVLGPRRRRIPGPPAFARVSVVVPARDELGWIERTIRSVRIQAVPAAMEPVEVVVVENGSADGTRAVAERLADVVVAHPESLAYGRARNLGAAAASGDLLVFLDADSRLERGALRELLARVRRGDLGTVLGAPDPPRLRYVVFLGLKNLGHRLRLYRGALGGMLFFDAALFGSIGGFDEQLEIDEIHDVVRRARRAGGRYVLVTGARAVTSMRRFQAAGLGSSFRHWLRLRAGLRAGAGYHRWVAEYRDRRHPRPAAEPSDSRVRTPPVPALLADPRRPASGPAPGWIGSGGPGAGEGRSSRMDAPDRTP